MAGVSDWAASNNVVSDRKADRLQRGVVRFLVFNGSLRLNLSRVDRDRTASSIGDRQTPASGNGTGLSLLCGAVC